MAINQNNWVDKLKSACDIVDVVRYYVPLVRKGDTFWGNCPFHHEKTPSFAVKQSGQFFHCFGCGEGGNVFTFVQKIESLSFIESAKLLGERYGVKLPDTLTSQNYNVIKSKKDALYNACSLAGKYYYNCLLKSKNAFALNYIRGRQVSDDYIKKFGIGYSPSWTGLIEYLKLNKVSLSTMVDAGLVQEINNSYYDVMCKRVTFPLFDYLGRCVGFSGRALEKDVNAKYKNTKETLIFNKSEFWYALNFVKKARKDVDVSEIIIVEGQLDAISCHQAGALNVVATLGTALTPTHAKTIKQIVNSVVLCFDGDSAGQKATLRAIEILKSEGLTVKVMALPEKLDPDEYIKKYGKDKFLEISKNAILSTDYILNVIKLHHDLRTNDGIVNYCKEAIAFVQKLGTFNERELALREVSKQSKIPLDVLKKDYDNINVEFSVNNSATKSSNRVSDAMIFCCAYLLDEPSRCTEQLKLEYSDDVLINIYNQICSQKTLSKDEIKNNLYHEFSQFSNYLDKIFNYNFDGISSKSQYFNDCKKSLELDGIDAQIKMLNDLMKDSEDKKSVLNKIQNLIIQKEKIKKNGGTLN